MYDSLLQRNGLPQPVNCWLKTEPLSSIVKRAQEILSLNQTVERFLPKGLSAACRVVNYQAGVLVVCYDSAIWTLRLRGFKSTLLSQLRTGGLSALASITFRLDPAPLCLLTPPRQPRSSQDSLERLPRQLSIKTQRVLLQLAAKSSPGIKQQLEKLVASLSQGKDHPKGLDDVPSNPLSTSTLDIPR